MKLHSVCTYTTRQKSTNDDDRSSSRGCCLLFPHTQLLHLHLYTSEKDELVRTTLVHDVDAPAVRSLSTSVTLHPIGDIKKPFSDQEQATRSPRSALPDLCEKQRVRYTIFHEQMECKFYEDGGLTTK